MIHSQQMAGLTGVVVGAGRSGVAAARLLAALGARTTLLETGEPSQAALALESAGTVHLVRGPHAPEHFAGADMVVLSPGVKPVEIDPFLADFPERKVLAELELASWFVSEPIIAVTGTSGKTTTVSLIAEMLRAAGRSVFVGGNIGMPLSEYLLDVPQAEILVLEVSSFQLSHVHSFKPHVAVLTNIAPNHLDWHPDMADYVAAKMKLFARMDQNDLAVVPLTLKDELEGRDFTRARKVFYVPSERFPETRLLGEHNRGNLEAAWLAARAFGVDEETARRAATEFKPLPHRLEHLGSVRGVIFVNDTKATTLDALAAAVAASPGPVRLLAGGVFKGGEPAGLAPLLQERAVAVNLFGASREIFEEAWQGRVPLTWSPTLEEAMRAQFAQAKPGEVILLSPATSSFDLYPNYKARGEDFRRVFQALKAEAAGEGA